MYLLSQDKRWLAWIQQKEELRKTAFSLRKLIKSNCHNELVITSHKALRCNWIIHRRLDLKFLFVWEYKTNEERMTISISWKAIPEWCINDADLKWLVETTDAVYLTRDMINDPPNHLMLLLWQRRSLVWERSQDLVWMFSIKGKLKLWNGGLLAVNRGSVDLRSFVSWNGIRLIKLIQSQLFWSGKGNLWYWRA